MESGNKTKCVERAPTTIVMDRSTGGSGRAIITAVLAYSSSPMELSMRGNGKTTSCMGLGSLLTIQAESGEGNLERDSSKATVRKSLSRKKP